MVTNVSYKELNNIIVCLDLYSRLYIGQYDRLVYQITGVLFYDSKEPVNSKLCELRNVFIPTLPMMMNTSLGIWSTETPMVAIRAFDIQQCLRYQNAMHNSRGIPTYGVNSRTPYLHGKWNMSKEDIARYRDILEKAKIYPEYQPNFFPRNAWNCPVIITNFFDDDVEIEMSNEVNKIIEDSKKAMDLTRRCKLQELFKLLYPDVDGAKYKPYTDALYKLLEKDILPVE